MSNPKLCRYKLFLMGVQALEEASKTVIIDLKKEKEVMNNKDDVKDANMLTLTAENEFIRKSDIKSSEIYWKQKKLETTEYKNEIVKLELVNLNQNKLLKMKRSNNYI